MHDVTPLVKDLVEPADGVGDPHLRSRLQPGCVSAVVGGQIEHFSGLLFSQRVEPHVGGGGSGEGQFLRRISIILCTDNKCRSAAERANLSVNLGCKHRRSVPINHTWQDSIK